MLRQYRTYVLPGHGGKLATRVHDLARKLVLQEGDDGYAFFRRTDGQAHHDHAEWELTRDRKTNATHTAPKGMKDRGD
jgi:hypothetical protein